jgi:Methionine aminopeptidase
VGEPSEDAKKIVSVAETCLRRGISKVKPGATIGDIGWAIQQYAEEKNVLLLKYIPDMVLALPFMNIRMSPMLEKRVKGSSLFRVWCLLLSP